MVIINRNRNTGILLSETATFARVIMMAEGPLDVQEIPKRALWKEYKQLENYADIKAANHYLNHIGGITLRAQRELQRIVGGTSSASQIARAAVATGIKVSTKGAVRDQVWAVADELWEAAGKPMDQKVVMKLRRVMMQKLESEFDVKLTTSSNELGNWMKARLA